MSASASGSGLEGGVKLGMPGVPEGRFGEGERGLARRGGIRSDRQGVGLGGKSCGERGKRVQAWGARG